MYDKSFDYKKYSSKSYQNINKRRRTRKHQTINVKATNVINSNNNNIIDPNLNGNLIVSGSGGSGGSGNKRGRKKKTDKIDSYHLHSHTKTDYNSNTHKKRQKKHSKVDNAMLPSDDDSSNVTHTTNERVTLCSDTFVLLVCYFVVLPFFYYLV